MKHTDNFNLKKPEQTDFYNVEDFNENAEIIDAEIQNRKTEHETDASNIAGLTNPTFDDSGSVEGISSFPDFLTKFKSKVNIFQWFRDFKAGAQFILHAGQIVNNCVTNNAGLPLSAAQGKVLMDLINKLNGDLQTAYLLKGGTPIPAGADLKSDTYKVPGNYYCDTNTAASTLINCPLSGAFVLKVELGTGTEYPKQIFIRYGSGENVIRTFNNSTNSWMDEYSYVRNSDIATTTIDITNKLASQYVDSSAYTPYSILIKSGNVITLMIFAAVKNLTGFDIILPAGAIPTSHRPKVEFTFSIHGRSLAQWLSATNYPVSLRAMEDGSVTLVTGANHGNVAFINATCTYVV